MMQSSRTSATKILILLATFSMLTTDAEALNCNSTTGSNLQCIVIVNNTVSAACLEPASNTSSAYNLLCDGNADCPILGADEGDRTFNPTLMCSELINHTHYAIDFAYALQNHCIRLHACDITFIP